MSDPYSSIAGPADPYASVASHAPAARVPSGGIDWGDIVKSAGSGLVTGLTNLSDALNPYNVVSQGVSLGAQVGSKVTGRPIPPAVQAMMPTPTSSATGQVTALGLNYQPHTTGGRYTKAIAQNAPNAFLGPEGAVPRVAAVVLPGLASEGAAQVTQALGGGQTAQNVARVVGGLGGGVAAGAAGAAAAPQVFSSEERPVVNALQSALDVGGTTPEALTEKLASGVPPMAASPGLAQTAETVASLPGPGAVALEQAAQGRLSEQTPRTFQAVNDVLGVNPQTARGDIDQLVQSGQAAVRPQYDALGVSQSPVWSESLANLSQRPAIKTAIRAVANGMMNRGENPYGAGFNFDPDTGWELNGANTISAETGGVVPGEPSPLPGYPTAATWIKVHQALGGTVERNPITGKPLPTLPNSTNEGIEQAGSDLRTALAGNPETGEAGAIPGYGDVLNQAGDYLSARSAFNRASGRLFAPSTSVDDFQKLWGSLKSPAEQEAARGAIANDILLRSDQGAFTPGLFKTPGVQQKLAVAFGNDKAAQFSDQMESDLAERGTYNKILQNSATARRQALQAAFQAQNKPGGVAGFANKALGAAEWAQAALHPTLFATKLAHAGVNALTGAPVGEGPLAPGTTATLGELLADPEKFAAFAQRMQQQRATPKPSALGGLRYGIPSALSGIQSQTAPQR